MSLVERAPLKNYRGKNSKGVVRYTDGCDVNRAEKEVVGSDKAKFADGKGIKRDSVYAQNNSGDSGTRRPGPRSRTS